MRIKFLFLLLVLFLVGLGVYIGLFFREQKLYWYIAEGGIVLILIYLSVFYHKIVKPLRTIGNGMELLREPSSTA